MTEQDETRSSAAETERQIRDAALLSSADTFKRSYAEMKKRAHERAEQLEAEGKTCDADPECEIMRLEAELKRAEYDNAGAFKWKSWSRKTVELFTGEEPEIALKDGEFAVSDKLKEWRYIFIGMTELDRLNKVGGQEAGDIGLAAVVKAVDEICARRLPAAQNAAKNIYRYGGNDYCIELDGVDERTAAGICAELSSVALDLSKIKLVKDKKIESPPLAVYQTSLEETVGILNATESSELREGIGVDAYEAAHESISILRRAVDYNLEVGKFVSRVDRAVEKIKSARAGEITQDEARSFFDNFLKKGFHGSGLESLKDIEDLWKDGADPADMRHAVEILAAAAARAKFIDDRKFLRYEDYIVRGHLKEATRHLLTGATHGSGSRELEDAPPAEIPKETNGQRELRRRKEEWNKEKIRPKENFDKNRARIAELRYLIEAARRDEGTGLLERGEFYEDFTVQISEGESSALVFLDMGFLKYFNDAGGRTVGDAGLKKAAKIMEDAIHLVGVKAEAYRYGGDEFAIRLEGGRAEAEQLVQAINEAAKEAGAIPDKAGLRSQGFTKDNAGESRPDYRPTNLVFNIGVSASDDAERALNDLEESGMLGDFLERRGVGRSEYEAELMVKMADTAVSFEKAVSRFHLLIGLMDRPEYADINSSYRHQVESIIKYSQKSILGSMGGDAALRFWQEERKQVDPKEFASQVERFVSDRLERTTDVIDSTKENVDKLVEIHAVRNRLIMQIAMLEKRLSEEAGELEHERHMREELSRRLAAAQADLDAALTSRKVINKVE